MTLNPMARSSPLSLSQFADIKMYIKYGKDDKIVAKTQVPIWTVPKKVREHEWRGAVCRGHLCARDLCAEEACTVKPCTEEPCAPADQYCNLHGAVRLMRNLWRAPGSDCSLTDRVRLRQLQAGSVH